MDQKKGNSRAGVLRGRALLLTAAALLIDVAAAPVAAQTAQSGPALMVTASRKPVEVAYVENLRKHLSGAMRYPTGRDGSLSRPDGTVSVWVEVTRDGAVAGRGVVRSSGSGLLDRMATNLVARTRYAPLPVEGWTDATTHRFLVSYRFDGAAAARQHDATVVVASSGW